MSTENRIIYRISREEFDKQIAWALTHTRRRLGFTYIARSTTNPDVYKVGVSRNPLKREKTFQGAYKPFCFKVLYFLARDIELRLLYAIHLAGAKSPLPDNYNCLIREAFFLNKKDVEYIVKKCGFKPISELALTSITKHI